MSEKWAAKWNLPSRAMLGRSDCATSAGSTTCISCVNNASHLQAYEQRQLVDEPGITVDSDTRQYPKETFNLTVVGCL